MPTRIKYQKYDLIIYCELTQSTVVSLLYSVHIVNMMVQIKQMLWMNVFARDFSLIPISHIAQCSMLIYPLRGSRLFHQHLQGFRIQHSPNEFLISSLTNFLAKNLYFVNYLKRTNYFIFKNITVSTLIYANDYPKFFQISLLTIN